MTVQSKGILAALVLAFGALASLWGPWDQPAGLDVWPALGNAEALWTGHWESWHDWRWPLHALLVGGGPLVPTAHMVSLLSVCGLIVAAFWRARQLAGATAGLWAALLVLASPDLVVFARMTTPYPLLACLVMASLVRGPLQPLALLALAAVDPRGVVLGSAALTGLLVERQWRSLGLGAAGLAMGCLLVVLLPVDLVPLWEQMDLQRRAQPDTLWNNLARCQRYLPWLLLPAGLAAVAGLQRRTLDLLALLLVGTSGALAVALSHRYLLPMLGPLAVLAAVGLSRLPRAWPGWVGIGLVLLGWQLHPESLRERGRPKPTSMTKALRTLEPGADEAVLDCVNGHLDLRLQGVEVRTKGCDRALRNGGPGLWVVTRGNRRVSERWEEVGRWPERPGVEIVVLHEPKR